MNHELKDQIGRMIKNPDATRVTFRVEIYNRHMVKRFVLVDSAGMIIAGPCPRSTDFTCNWSPDRELVVVYTADLKVGDYIDIEKGEEVTDSSDNGGHLSADTCPRSDTCPPAWL